MKSSSKFFLIFGVVVLLVALVSFKEDHRNLQQQNLKIKWNRYPNSSFVDISLAYLTLKELDVFVPVDSSYFSKPTQFDEPRLSLKHNQNYCDDHRDYFVKHTGSFFEDKFNYFTDYSHSSLLREKVLTALGNDLHPKISAAMPKKSYEKRLYSINPATHVFNTLTNLPTFQEVGKHFSCVTQASARIPGVAAINRKDWVASSTISYAESFSDRSHCFNFEKFFPKTWILRNKTQCEELFTIFNSKEYEKLKKEREIVYIRKIGAGSHRGQGVQPIDNEEESKLRKIYKNGALCGEVDKNFIVQHYVHNPLLLNGHKFDFRMYMLIASTNPLIAYYHDGFLRVSLHAYNVSSKDKGTLLTNTALSATAFDIAKSNGTFMGMNEEELRNFQMWNFNKLEAHLVEIGKTNDTNWLNNYLRPQFRKAMIHLVRMAQDSYLSRSSLYELFGVDFMLDENLDLWFIECNSGPVLKGSSEEKERFVTKMLRDQYEIVLGLTRSRITRIIKFVNNLITSNSVKKFGPSVVIVEDLIRRREEFARISKNWFEPQYTPSERNGFYKIIDDNKVGVDRYSGLLSPECL